MIVEVRDWRAKPGARDAFPALVERRVVPSAAGRERMRQEFYGGGRWTEDLEQEAMPLLESYDVLLCEATPGCTFGL
ncbi:MAG: hypothetical protein ACREQM_17435 [Candidatus Dormibacteraceae bacterium]